MCDGQVDGDGGAYRKPHEWPPSSDNIILRKVFEYGGGLGKVH